MAKWYAVTVGKVPGVYNTWNECVQNVSGYSNNSYKGFETREEAEAYYLITMKQEGKEARRCRSARIKNFVILFQFIVIVCMFIFLVCVCM